MAHSQSVIPLWINNWRADFYASLTEKENWSFNSNISFWKPEFQRLAEAMNSYRNHNRESEISSLFFAGYGYAAMVKMYGINSSYMYVIDGSIAYSMDGFVSQTLARPTNYYNDASLTEPTSMRMDESVSRVSGAIAVEASPSTSGMIGAVQGTQFKLLFNDLDIQESVNKGLMKDLFFNELGWRNVFQNLNVGGLTIP